MKLHFGNATLTSNSATHRKPICGISFLPVTVGTETENKVAGAGEIKSNKCT